MALFFDCLGMGAFAETEESLTTLLQYALSAGKPLPGYYGAPCVNARFGGAELVLETRENPENGQLTVTNLSTHCGGNTVWAVKVKAGLSAGQGENGTVLAVSRPDGNGLAVVHIVNAPVLPGFLPGTALKLQTVAFPLKISYYKNEDAYAAEAKGRLASRYLLADGAVIPSGLLDPEKADGAAGRDIVHIRATVESVYWGKLEIAGVEEKRAFLRCRVNTAMGPLEIVHTPDMVAKKQRQNIAPGAVVYGAFVLSGDGAVYEYENGILLDEENDLRALGWAVAQGDADRLAGLLAPGAVYVNEYSGDACQGYNAVLARIRQVLSAPGRYAVRLAAQTKGQSEANLSRRCLLVYEHGERRPRVAVHIGTDEAGRIDKICLRYDENAVYHPDPEE